MVIFQIKSDTFDMLWILHNTLLYPEEWILYIIIYYISWGFEVLI